MSPLPNYTDVTTNGPAAAKRISEHTATFFNYLRSHERNLTGSKCLLNKIGESDVDNESVALEMNERASKELDRALNMIEKISKLGATDAVMKDLWSAYEQTQRM